MEEHKAYSAVEICEEIGCDKSSLYYHFTDADKEPAVGTVKGVTVTRVHKDNADVTTETGHQKWVFYKGDITEEPKEGAPEEEKVEEPKEGAPEEEKVEEVSPAPDRSGLKDQWRKLQRKAAQSFQALEEIADHVSDPGIIQDDELWEFICSEREEHTQQLKKVLPELGRVTAKARKRIKWVDSIEEDESAEDEEDDYDCADDADVEVIDKFEGITLENNIERDETNVLLYGGTPNSTLIERLQQDMPWDNVVWVDGQRRVSSEIQRLKNGKYDMSICLARVSSHQFIDKMREACKHSGTPFINVEDGIGLSSIKREVKNTIEGDVVPHGAGSSATREVS